MSSQQPFFYSIFAIMNKNILYLGFALALIGCMQPLKKTSNKQTFLVQGSINGDFEDYIYIRFDGALDSAKVINNSFQLIGEVSSPKAFQFKFDSISTSDVFYLENDTLLFDILIDEETIDGQNFKLYETKQVSGGKTPTLKKEIETYFKSFSKSKKSRDALYSKMDSLIKKYPNHDYLGKVLSQIAMEQNLLFNDIRGLYSNLDVDELNPNDVAILENYQNKRKVFQIGNEIPNYELISIDSKAVEFKSHLAQYTLIQFWNSWCEKCRLQNNKLKEIYEKYNFKNFEIISISLDTNQQDWTSSVMEDSLPWESYRIEKGFTGKMSSDMGIIHLPQYYLIDEKGRIIEINLSTDELDTILSALLN